MKHLLIIRHAHAESESFQKPDFERQLDDRGQAEAAKLGSFINSKKTEPEIVLCSQANRTLATARIAIGQLNQPAELVQSLKLYNSNFQMLLGELKKSNLEAGCMAIVAHNPGISQLATALCKEGSYQLAPAAAVCLQFNVLNWKEISPGTGKEIWYFYP